VAATGDGLTDRQAGASDVEWIEINGYPMAYQDSGAGAPLILVHGSLCDYRMWPGQLEAFSKKHRVLNVPALSSLRRRELIQLSWHAAPIPA
jgi:hypothetical protein